MVIVSEPPNDPICIESCVGVVKFKRDGGQLSTINLMVLAIFDTLPVGPIGHIFYTFVHLTR